MKRVVSANEIKIRQTKVEYWKGRCERAEAYIELCPCDPDIFKDQWDAYVLWKNFKEIEEPK